MAFGRMDSKKGNEPMSDINVTPLVDVMLVLLVIFIITAPILASSIKLDLPKSDAAKAAGDPPKFISLVVDKDGRLYFNDEVQTLEKMRSRLVETASVAPETEVQLRADQGVPYGRVLELIGDAQKAGLSRIGFVAEQPAGGTAAPAEGEAAAEAPTAVGAAAPAAPAADSGK